MLQAFPEAVAEDYVGQRAGHAPTSGRNRVVYDAAAEILGDTTKVYYSTKASYLDGSLGRQHYRDNQALGYGRADGY